MRKIGLLNLAVIILGGMILAGSLPDARRSMGQADHSDRPNILYVMSPKENSVFKLPKGVLVMVRITYPSKVRLDFSNSSGTQVKIIHIKSSEFKKIAPYVYVHKREVKLTAGKYNLTATPLTNLTPGTKAVGPIHFSVAYPKIELKPYFSIKINSPEGGKTYYIGATVPILWETEKIKQYGTVHLQICWADGTPAAGTFPVKNDGSHEWVINETQENSLRLKIFTHDKLYSGLTGIFQVKFTPRKKTVIGKND